MMSHLWWFTVLQAAVEAEMYQNAPSMRSSVLDALLEYILGAITGVVAEQLAGELLYAPGWACTHRPQAHA